MTEKRHERGKAKMAEVYAWQSVPDVPGDFFAITVSPLYWPQAMHTRCGIFGAPHAGQA